MFGERFFVLSFLFLDTLAVIQTVIHTSGSKSRSRSRNKSRSRSSGTSSGSVAGLRCQRNATRLDLVKQTSIFLASLPMHVRLLIKHSPRWRGGIAAPCIPAGTCQTQDIHSITWLPVPPHQKQKVSTKCSACINNKEGFSSRGSSFTTADGHLRRKVDRFLARSTAFRRV